MENVIDISLRKIALGIAVAGSFLVAPLVLAQQSAPPIVIGHAELAPASDQLALSGSATARRVSMISPLIDGLVATMLVDVGDHVDAGQALARLDPVIARHELATAEAALAEELARSQEAVRRRDEAAEVHAEALIAGTVYESSVAEANIRAAVVRRLQAERDRHQEILDRHTVRAPFPGLVARKMAEAGQWVQRTDALFELVDSDVLRVDVSVPQNRYADVVAGTPATIRFDALPDAPVEAVVTTRLAIGDPAARTFLARIEIDNPETMFAPGMSARVVLRPGAQDAASVLQVPRDAVMRMPDGGHRLWRVRDDVPEPTVQPVEIEVMRFTGGVAVIAPGTVAAGDRIVVRGNESLKPDQTVRIVESGS